MTSAFLRSKIAPQAKYPIHHPNNELQNQILTTQKQQEHGIVKTSLILVEVNLHTKVFIRYECRATCTNRLAHFVRTLKRTLPQNLVHGGPSCKRLGLQCQSRSVSISTNDSQVVFWTARHWLTPLNRMFVKCVHTERVSPNTFAPH